MLLVILVSVEVYKLLNFLVLTRFQDEDFLLQVIAFDLRVVYERDKHHDDMLSVEVCKA